MIEGLNYMDMKILQVLDRLVPYDAFLNDLAARIVGMMKADSNDPERRMNCLEGAMWKDGNGKGRWNPIKDLERWNTGLQISAFYSVPCRITLNRHYMKKAVIIRNKRNK